MTTPILFVCLGNICRSPSAEAVSRAVRGTRDLALDSAGTAGWHVGKAPYGPMQTAAQARGITMEGLRARQVSTEDFHRFDWIIAMDEHNLKDLQEMAPQKARAQLRLLTSFLPDGLGDIPKNVPDPYYTRDFDGTLDLIETAVAALLAAYDAGDLTALSTD